MFSREIQPYTSLILTLTPSSPLFSIFEFELCKPLDKDISAVLRVFQRYRDTNSLNFCLALQKVATAMNERIIKAWFS